MDALPARPVVFRSHIRVAMEEQESQSDPAVVQRRVEGHHVGGAKSGDGGETGRSPIWPFTKGPAMTASIWAGSTNQKTGGP